MTEEVYWDPQTIESLNKHQLNPRFHPYTCPEQYLECKDQRELVATQNGWICKCGKYTQNWRHEFNGGNK
jgi:hypothetical protein